MAQDILEVSDGRFEEEVLKSSTPVLVDFWATWCGPCKALAPTLSTLARDYSGRVKFCKVDVDQNPQNAAQYGVRSIPALLLFQKGKVLGQLIGNVPRASIESLFQKANLEGAKSPDSFVKT